MGATRQKLLEVSYVTGHDCGNYRIGEIDFGVNGSLREYLQRYGRDGRDGILIALGHLAHQVELEFSAIMNMERSGSQAKAGSD